SAIVPVPVADNEMVRPQAAEFGNRDPDKRHRSETTERNGFVPRGYPSDAPFTSLQAGGVDLHVSCLVGLMIHHDRSQLLVEGEPLATVDDASTGGNRIDPGLALRQSQRQGERLTSCGFPMLEVVRTGVGEMVVGRAVGRVAPNPNRMK